MVRQYSTLDEDFCLILHIPCFMSDKVQTNNY